MRQTLLALLLTLVSALPAGAQGGLVSVQSHHDLITTVNRLERVLTEKGATLFGRIDHAAEAQRAGVPLRPTLLILFGEPALEAALVQRSRSMGIDLPLKTLVWEDRAGTVWISYNAPDYLARRHGITEMGEVLQRMEQWLSELALAATRP